MNIIILLTTVVIVILTVLTIYHFGKRKKTKTPVIKQTEITKSSLPAEDKRKDESAIENSFLSTKALTETPKFAYTHGEKGFYAEKLQDSRWESMGDEICKRDGYLCQQCRNCINTVYYLSNISDLLNITKVSIGLYQTITAAFTQKDYILEDLLSDVKKRKCNLNYFLKTYNTEMRNYIYSVERISYSLTNDIPSNIPHKEIISCNEIITDINCLYSDYSKKYYDSPFHQKYKIHIGYFSNTQTDDKLFLKFNLGNTNLTNLGQWSIHQNGFVVSFSGFYQPQQIKLNVHHKIYPKSGNPWDSDPDDLITLCSICHKAEHERLGFKIPIKDN